MPEHDRDRAEPVLPRPHRARPGRVCRRRGHLQPDVDGVGLATVADSFAAIEQRVVNEKRLTWEELAQHLTNNFAGAEDVRLMLKNIPRYGSGGARADGWAKRVSQLYTHLVRGTPTPHGFTVIPGLFSHGIVNQLGQRVGATPNGRHAGEPISHSADPDPGFCPAARPRPRPRRRRWPACSRAGATRRRCRSSSTAAWPRRWAAWRRSRPCSRRTTTRAAR